MKRLTKILLLFVLLLVLPSTTSIFTNQGMFNISRTQNYSNGRLSRRELKNIVVFIEFSDSDTNVIHHLDDEQSIINANEIYNSDGFEMETEKGLIKVPSVKTYFESESYGQLSITTDFFPKQNNKVESYKDDKPIGYYLKYTDSNPIGYKNREEANEREATLVQNATAYISNQLSSYGFTESNIDTDNDGLIDAISFIVEGQPNIPNYITWQDLLWNHKSSNKGNISAKILNKSVGDYNLLYAGDYTEQVNLFSKNRGQYGSIVHELGHTLGFSDLYRYGNSTKEKPVGFFDVMGNVISSYPQHFLTYFISEYNIETNWHDPLPVIDKTTNSFTLYKPEFINPSEARAIKIKPDANKDEYFIVEYHEKQNTYDSHSVDKSGIIVYRVNENNKYMGNVVGGINGEKDHIFVFRPGEAILGEASGNLNEATLNMDRKTLGKTEITDGTFDNQTIYYTDGTNSRIKIEVTNETSDSITFNIEMPTVTGSGTSTDPYIISSTEEFLYLMTLDTKNKYYRINTDIDFKDIQKYPEINFRGYLDGNNKTIKNISTIGTGLFASVGEYRAHTEIKDLIIENINVSPLKGDYLGALASTASNATLKNIHIKSGSVTNIEDTRPYASAIASTGGFLGNASNDTYIENCSTKVSISAPKNVGGFIGLNMNAIIKNSFTQSTVQGNSNVGAFFGLQYIMDNVYNVPTNAFYDYTHDESIKAVGGYAYDHKLSTLDEYSLAKGITGVKVPELISLNINETTNYRLNSIPEASLNYTVSIENPTLAQYQNGIIKGLSSGSTKAYMDILVGTSIMRLTTNINVSNTSTDTLNEIDILNYFGLTKKDGYICGFTLNTDIRDIRKSLSSYTGVTLKGLQSSSNNEIYEGPIATGMKITLNFNNTDYHYTVVVKGDINGDGYIYATDYVKIKNHIMGKTTLTGAYALAADVNNDASIYATDYVKIKNYIMGKGTISQT